MWQFPEVNNVELEISEHIDKVISCQAGVFLGICTDKSFYLFDASVAIIQSIGLLNFESEICTLSCSPDGQLLLCGCVDNTLHFIVNKEVTTLFTLDLKSCIQCLGENCVLSNVKLVQLTSECIDVWIAFGSKYGRYSAAFNTSRLLRDAQTSQLFASTKAPKFPAFVYMNEEDAGNDNRTNILDILSFKMFDNIPLVIVYSELHIDIHSFYGTSSDLISYQIEDDCCIRRISAFHSSTNEPYLLLLTTQGYLQLLELSSDFLLIKVGEWVPSLDGNNFLLDFLIISEGNEVLLTNGQTDKHNSNLALCELLVMVRQYDKKNSDVMTQYCQVYLFPSLFGHQSIPIYQLSVTVGTKLINNSAVMDTKSLFLYGPMSDESKLRTPCHHLLNIKSIKQLSVEDKLRQLLVDNNFEQAELLAKLYHHDMQFIYKLKFEYLVTSATANGCHGNPVLLKCLQEITDVSNCLASVQRSFHIFFANDDGLRLQTEFFALLKQKLESCYSDATTLSTKAAALQELALCQQKLITFIKMQDFLVNVTWFLFKQRSMYFVLFKLLSKGNFNLASLVWQNHKNEISKEFSDSSLQDVLQLLSSSFGNTNDSNNSLSCSCLLYATGRDFVKTCLFSYVLDYMSNSSVEVCLTWLELQMNSLEATSATALSQPLCTYNDNLQAYVPSEYTYDAWPDNAYRVLHDIMQWIHARNQTALGIMTPILQKNDGELKAVRFVALDAMSSWQSLKRLQTDLMDVKYLKERYHFCLNLASYRSESVKTIANRMLNHELYIGSVSQAMSSTRITTYLQDNGMDKDLFLFNYSKELMNQNTDINVTDMLVIKPLATNLITSNKDVKTTADIQAQILLILPHISNLSYRLELLLLLVQYAALPWTDNMSDLVQAHLHCCNHVLVQRLKVLYADCAMQQLLMKYRVRKSITGRTDAERLIKCIMYKLLLNKDEPITIEIIQDMIRIGRVNSLSPLQVFLIMTRLGVVNACYAQVLHLINIIFQVYASFPALLEGNLLNDYTDQFRLIFKSDVLLSTFTCIVHCLTVTYYMTTQEVCQLVEFGLVIGNSLMSACTNGETKCDYDIPLYHKSLQRFALLLKYYPNPSVYGLTCLPNICHLVSYAWWIETLFSIMRYEISFAYKISTDVIEIPASIVFLCVDMSISMLYLWLQIIIDHGLCNSHACSTLLHYVSLGTMRITTVKNEMNLVLKDCLACDDGKMVLNALSFLKQIVHVWISEANADELMMLLAFEDSINFLLLIEQCIDLLTNKTTIDKTTSTWDFSIIFSETYTSLQSVSNALLYLINTVRPAARNLVLYVWNSHHTEFCFYDFMNDVTTVDAINSMEILLHYAASLQMQYKVLIETLIGFEGANNCFQVSIFRLLFNMHANFNMIWSNNAENKGVNNFDKLNEILLKEIASRLSFYFMDAVTPKFVDIPYVFCVAQCINDSMLTYTLSNALRRAACSKKFNRCVVISHIAWISALNNGVPEQIDKAKQFLFKFFWNQQFASLHVTLTDSFRSGSLPQSFKNLIKDLLTQVVNSIHLNDDVINKGLTLETHDDGELVNISEILYGALQDCGMLGESIDYMILWFKGLLKCDFGEILAVKFGTMNNKDKEQLDNNLCLLKYQQLYQYCMSVIFKHADEAFAIIQSHCSIMDILTAQLDYHTDLYSYEIIDFLLCKMVTLVAKNEDKVMHDYVTKRLHLLSYLKNWKRTSEILDCERKWFQDYKGIKPMLMTECKIDLSLWRLRLPFHLLLHEDYVTQLIDAEVTPFNVDQLKTLIFILSLNTDNFYATAASKLVAMHCNLTSLSPLSNEIISASNVVAKKWGQGEPLIDESMFNLFVGLLENIKNVQIAIKTAELMAQSVCNGWEAIRAIELCLSYTNKWKINLANHNSVAKRQPTVIDLCNASLQRYEQSLKCLKIEACLHKYCLHRPAFLTLISKPHEMLMKILHDIPSICQFASNDITTSHSYNQLLPGNSLRHITAELCHACVIEIDQLCNVQQQDIDLCRLCADLVTTWITGKSDSCHSYNVKEEEGGFESPCLLMSNTVSGLGDNSFGDDCEMTIGFTSMLNPHVVNSNCNASKISSVINEQRYEVLDNIDRVVCLMKNYKVRDFIWDILCNFVTKDSSSSLVKFVSLVCLLQSLDSCHSITRLLFVLKMTDLSQVLGHLEQLRIACHL